MRSLKHGCDKDILNKWGKTGILDNSVNKTTMAIACETAVRILIGYNSEVSVNDGLIIPLIFRIINKINPIGKFMIRKITKDIIRQYPVLKLKYRNQFEYQLIGIDIECHMLDLITEQYLLDYENNKSI
jgi:hypothetical protein